VASHSAFVAVERHRMAVEMDRILTDEQKKAAELRAQRLDARSAGTALRGRDRGVTSLRFRGVRFGSGRASPC
jgi:hypothetical protein